MREVARLRAGTLKTMAAVATCLVRNCVTAPFRGLQGVIQDRGRAEEEEDDRVEYRLETCN